MLPTSPGPRPVPLRRGPARAAGQVSWRVALVLLLGAGAAQAGFNDPGQPPVSMVAWATSVVEVMRGPTDPLGPLDPAKLASFGVPENALGPATLDNEDVVSLGDGGHITLSFSSGISDGPGDDFAVYENGFFSGPGLFAEFAFVEVSTDGTNFARMPSRSLRTTPVPPFVVVNPLDYDFAGDQPQGLGTGFDLADIASDPLVLSGDVDLTEINYVKVIDVIGDGSKQDADGYDVYDPYPTVFPSGGFDLEAVGVIHALPEPGAPTLLGAGVLLLARLRARRRARGPARA